MATPTHLLLTVSLCICAVLAAVLLRRLVGQARQRTARRRAAGYRLIDCLKAYTAWVDWHRDEPLLRHHPGELELPAPLAEAVRIKDAHFPQLSPLTVQLLQSHRELMQYLWEENILRITHSMPRRPHYADPRYHQLRDRQDAALDSLFLQCRQLVGDKGVAWNPTHSDFTFSSNMHHTR